MTVRVPTIDHDVPCVACGYNLRGLTRDGRCPECGLMVGPSLDADRGTRSAHRLRESDPRWLAALARGAVAMVGAIVAVWLAYAVAPLVVPHLKFGWDQHSLYADITARVLAVYAIVLVTSREPGTAAVHRTRWVVLRWAALAHLASMLTIGFRVDEWIGDAGDAALAVLLIPPLFVIPPVAAALFYLRINELAARLPRGHLAVQAKLLAWVAGALATIAAVGATGFHPGPLALPMAGGAVDVRGPLLTSGGRFTFEDAVAVVRVATMLWATFVLVDFAFAILTARRDRRASTVSGGGAAER